MSLKEYSAEELRQELIRREEESLMAEPIPMDEIDWEPLVKLITGTVETMRNEGYQHKDFKQYLFETAMEAVYGKNVWGWYNDLL